MSATLALYRALTGAVGAAAVPLGAALAPRGSAWRERWGRIEGLERAAGGPWIHAASMGEAVAARHWAEALLAAGNRAPLLVTTRTKAGLARIGRDLGARAVAALAPLDFPSAIRRLLREAAPSRLDLVETELWPNLIGEALRASVPVVAVSATVSARTAGRLRALGLAGPGLFGSLHVLAQTEVHAARYHALGVPEARIRVVGDLKAPDEPVATRAPGSGPRRLIVFASLRPGEETTAVAIASALSARSDASSWRYVVAPRHDEGVRSAAAALEAAGFAVERRSASSPGRRDADRADDAGGAAAWSDAIPDPGARSVGLLATRGELPELFPRTRVAVVGGTFAPFGGHSVLEPAAAGATVVVGPFHGEVEAGVAALRRHGACVVASDGAAAAAAVVAALGRPEEGAAEAARAGARSAAGAARRGLEALAGWGLLP